MGKAVDDLGGRFVTGEGAGIAFGDVALMRESTDHVLGSEGSDSDKPAAAGVLAAIRSAAQPRPNSSRGQGVQMSRTRALGRTEYGEA